MGKPQPVLRPRRLWIVVFTISWLPILVGLAQRGQIALDSQFWDNLGIFVPKAVGLRIYWIIMIPLVTGSLLLAAGLLLGRRRYAALLASAVFITAIAMNIGELAIVTALHSAMARSIATSMGVPSERVSGLQIGIALSYSTLVYKTLCLLFLHHGIQVKEAFGPVTWQRLRLWVVRILDGESMDEAAAD